MALGQAEYTELRRRIAAAIWEKLNPLETLIEDSESLPYDQLWPILQECQAFALLVPAEYGGLGLSVEQYLPILAEFAKIQGGIRVVVHVHNSFAHALSEIASKEQRAEILPLAARGENSVAFALTEPGNGTGADLSTRADRDGAGYRLTGRKWLITNSDFATHFIVLAKTADKQISAFLVARDSPGFTIEALPETMGCKGGQHGELSFDQVYVPAENLIGDEGQGGEHLERALEISRVFIAASSWGTAERSLELSRAYAGQRSTFGKPIAGRQAVQRYLAEMAIDVYALRSMLLDAARKWDAGQRIPAESSMCKQFGLEAVGRVTDRALLVHGGIGYTRRHPIERLYRDARLNWLEEGTPTIQYMVIARELAAGYTFTDDSARNRPVRSVPGERMAAVSARDAVIVEAVRTPIGKRNGRLSGVHPVDLSAHVLTALTDRAGVDPALVDDVVWGCVSQVGEQTSDIARTAVLAAGWPESVTGVTVDRQCGSSQQSVHFAAAGLIAGHYDVVVAGGVESMSRVPMFSAVGDADPFGAGFAHRYDGAQPNQGLAAEMVSQRWGLSRSELDEYAVESQERAARARDDGRFDGQIAALADPGDGSAIVTDQGIRQSSVAALGKLNPAFRPNGVITAGNSSQISDGAAALLMTTGERARELGLRPIARLHTAVLAGSDPIIMLTAPMAATEKALARSGLSLAEIGVYEVNEAFACVPLAWLADTGADAARMNPNGGAIALGHPLGASGARLMTTLVHHMREQGIRFGLQTMCEAGGQANATVLELL